MGIFWVLLLLTAAADFKHLLFSETAIAREKEKGEEVLRRLKEQEASLQLLYLRLKKEIVELELKQEALKRPALALERKIQHCICKALLLAAILLLKLWE